MNRQWCPGWAGEYIDWDKLVYIIRERGLSRFAVTLEGIELLLGDGSRIECLMPRGEVASVIETTHTWPILGEEAQP